MPPHPDSEHTVRSEAFLIMAIPALVALAGGVLAAHWNPSREARSLIQHFASGVVLAALDLFPEISRGHVAAPVLAGSFALGSLFMFALKIWTTRMEHREAAVAAGGAAGLASGLMAATFIDVAVRSPRPKSPPWSSTVASSSSGVSSSRVPRANDHGARATPLNESHADPRRGRLLSQGFQP
jgi:hypothetical protein